MKRSGATYTPQELLNNKTVKDYKGLFICRICGKSYNSICGHLSSAHKMTVEEYCKKYRCWWLIKKYKAMANPLTKEQLMSKMTNIHRGIKASKVYKILKNKLKGEK